MMFKAIGRALERTIVSILNYETALLKLRAVTPRSKKPTRTDLIKLATLARIHGYTVEDYDRMMEGKR